MQTLGLSSETKRTDGWLKGLLWPSVENAWDVDYIGQQGMLICTLVAAFSLLTMVFSGSLLAIVFGLLAALFYVIGGMGVREANWLAAATVFLVYLFDMMIRLVGGRFPSIISILFAIILLTNTRAAFLASEWKPPAEGEDRPSRFSESLWDKYVDQMPRLLWPKLQFPFIALGVLMLSGELVVLGFGIAHRMGLLGHS
jgi:hypothetical protein